MNIVAPINQLGYGIVGANLTINIIKIDKETCLFPLGDIDCSENCREQIKEALNNSLSYKTSDPSLKIYHAWDLHSQPSKKFNSGLTFFEIDYLNKQEVNCLNQMDVVFSAGEWAKKIMEDNGVKSKIVPISIGVDTETFFPVQKENHEKVIFINCGKWEIRKGHDVLLDIFNNAFNKEDNVELWMMNSNLFISQEEQKEWEKYYTNSALGDKIKIVPRMQSPKNVHNIFARADCGIFPSRAEGWNMECAELMAMGKHVIVSNCTAHSDYCNENNSILVDLPHMEKAHDGKWFLGTGNWHKIDQKAMGDFSQSLRDFYKKKINNAIINMNGIETFRILNWNSIAKKILSVVNSYGI